ncbi:Transcription factor WhiB [Lentzea albidocapillata subsp. violacea]|uniref:Transcriptional regulator WhiB n=1 Tax=Lentzea albidocapillata subsp. violacea TaxID=128104 RepID=A0A1G9I0N8_9PSEU|nr:WhiB family transcriptional regulator [Lentzea albidocapillata]SDL18616.1 Transcription factor WhiB [Lentzea albidocapillata subsp. violacea]
MLPRLPEWQIRAACKGRIDLDFIEPKSPAEDAKCRALCAGCPVREQCLTAALASGEAWGLWGGLDAEERLRVAERDGHELPAVLPAHGTNPRYAKHGCRCDLCRTAHTDYERTRRALRRRRAEPEPEPIMLAEAVRIGRVWAGAGQLLLPLPGVPRPREAEPVELLASAA